MEEPNHRYEMCKDQPAQIDCRNTKCIYHKEGNCTNVSPAITIKDNFVTCWSEKENPLEFEYILNSEKGEVLMKDFLDNVEHHVYSPSLSSELNTFLSAYMEAVLEVKSK